MNYESFKLVPFDMQNFQAPVQYCNGFPQLGQMPRTQASISYRTPVMRPFSVAGLNQTSGDAVYMQWPTSAMMYAQSYDQFMHVFQVKYAVHRLPIYCTFFLAQDYQVYCAC